MAMEIRLERKMDAFLLDWKAKKNRKPLIIKGARQIGKTDCIRRLAKFYEHFVEIDFKLQPQYRTIVPDPKNPIPHDTRSNTQESVIKEITAIDPSKVFVPGKTLILFDEIQACPQVCTALKSFCEKGDYDLICSGSLLGINYEAISSIAVGYKEDVTMHGLDFEEFLWAKGYPKSLRSELLNSMVEGIPLSESLFSALRSHFFDFSVLGGMPAVVKDFIATGTFSGSLSTQRQIILDYRDDMKQYAGGLDKVKIEAVYDRIPVQLGKDNPKFQLTKVAHGARAREYEGVKEWLKDSGIVLISYNLNFPELPLKGNYQPDNFRLYLSDTGLLIASLDEETQEDLRANKNLGVYRGAITENMIADSFAKQGLELFFYKREDGTLEEDFFVRDAHNLIPVEAKSRNGHSKSLKALIEGDKYPDVSWGIKLGDTNIGDSGTIKTFPYFLSFLLKDYLKNHK